MNEPQEASGLGTYDKDVVEGDDRSCERKEGNKWTELPVQKPARCGKTSVSSLLHMNAFPRTNLNFVTGSSAPQGPPGK